MFDSEGFIREYGTGRALAPGFTARTLSPDGVEAAAQLIHDAAIETGGRRYSILMRKLADQLAMLELWHGMIAVRDSDNAIVGLASFAARKAFIDGKELLVSSAFHSAVAGDARRLGLDSHLRINGIRKVAFQADTGFGYTDAGNDTVMATLAGMPSWTQRVWQLGISASQTAALAGRSPEPHHESRLLDLLRATHGQEELRPPFTDAWFRKRFGTIASYGLNDIRMTDNAMLGLWLPRDEVKDVSPEVTRECVMGYVPDYGFTGPTGLSEFLTLLDDARARAANAGCTHLIIYSSKGSPGAQAIAERAAWNDELLLTGFTPEPSGTTTNGIYTDSFYI